MTHAVVLIEAEREAIQTLGGQLADVEGVGEAYSVTGEWDFVAIVRVRSPEEVPKVVTQRFADIPGISPHAHDGRVRGVLAARPGGPFLHRELGVH